MGLALELAQRANALRAETFPPEARRWAITAITDMLGCALAGAQEACTGTMLHAVGGGVPGASCSLPGRAERLPPLEAALVHGTAGHALDFDDTSKSMAGHPTVVIVPALLALAEQRDASGEALLEAYIVGVEVATRIARGVNFHHYEKGWHPTATLGIFGAAAACGRLIGLEDARLANALSLCVSLAAGVKSNFGTQAKPLHAGNAARNGLLAALLAEGGFTAGADAFEHPQGFLEVFNGAGHHDATRMLDGWGAPLDLLAPGISIKKYPCVYSVHGALDAAIALHRRHALDPARIARVTVTMHRRRLLPHVQRPATSTLDAKFSLPYNVVRALISGRVGLADFEGDAFRDPIIRAVMGRIATRPHDDDSNDYGAEVEVVLADGTVLRESVSAPLGRGPETPLPVEMLRMKFEDCATRILPVEAASCVFESLQTLDALPSVRRLTAMMVPPG